MKTTGSSRRGAAGGGGGGGVGTGGNGGASNHLGQGGPGVGPHPAMSGSLPGPECAGCQKPIRERFLLKALDQLWHEDCLKCACCDCRLGEVGSTLFTKANLILCKRDYLSFPCLPKPKVSRAASHAAPTARAKSCPSVLDGAKEGPKARPTPTGQEKSSHEEGRQLNASQELEQKVPPQTFAAMRFSALQKPKGTNNVAPARAERSAAPASATQTVVATGGVGGSSQATALLEASEGSTFTTAESAAKSPSAKDISVSERSSAYETAQEVGALRSCWNHILRRKRRKSALVATTCDDLCEDDPQGSPGSNAATEVSPEKKDDGETSPPSSTAHQDSGTPAEPKTSDAKNSDTATTASIQPSNNSESQSVGCKPGVAAQVCDSSFLPERKQTHRTPSSFKEWPKHESETIPDPASVIFMKTQPQQLSADSSSASVGRRGSSIPSKTAQALSLKKNGQRVYWESLFESNAHTSPQTPTALKTGTAANETLGHSEEKDDSGASDATGKTIHRKSIDIKRTSSADLVNVVLEVNSSLYSPHFLLNFDEDQIEDPTPLGAAGARRLSLPEAQAQQLSLTSPFSEQRTEISPQSGTLASTSQAATAGQSVEPAEGSKPSKVTFTMTSILSDIIVTVTSQRYWILLTFCALSMINAFQWIQYSIIASVIKDHYGVSDATISWTSMLYLIGYMVLAFPSAWILDNMGLRVTVLIGAAGTAIGACIKTFAVKPGQFALVICGQAFPAFAQAFILGIPPRLSSAWFRYEEISTACSLGVLGNNLGIALGFVIPPNVVHVNDVESSLLYLSATVAVASCVCLFVILVAFKDQPEHPPSYSEMLTRRSTTRLSFAATFGALLGDFNFCLLLLSYGLNTGAFYSLSTLLNPVVLVYFPGEEAFAGWLGLALILAGLVGSWLCGVTLDRTGKYKEVTLFTYVFSTVGLFAYTFILSARSHLLSLFACLFLGFFMTGYIPIGLQFAAEITYPMPEGMSANIMNVSAQAIGFLMILGSSHIQETYGDFVSNICLSALLVVGCLMTANTRARLKRQEAYREGAKRRSGPTVPSTGDHSPAQGSQRTIPSGGSPASSDRREDSGQSATQSAHLCICMKPTERQRKSPVANDTSVARQVASQDNGQSSPTWHAQSSPQAQVAEEHGLPPTQHRVADDWSQLLQLDSESSHYPESTESEGAQRASSVCSLPNERTSKAVSSGALVSRTAVQKKKSFPEHKKPVSGVQESVPQSKEQVLVETPPSTELYDSAKPAVTFSSEVLSLQKPTAPSSPYPASILKKPTAPVMSSTDSEPSSPPADYPVSILKKPTAAALSSPESEPSSPSTGYPRSTLKKPTVAALSSADSVPSGSAESISFANAQPRREDRPWFAALLYEPSSLESQASTHPSKTTMNISKPVLSSPNTHRVQPIVQQDTKDERPKSMSPNRNVVDDGGYSLDSSVGASSMDREIIAQSGARQKSETLSPSSERAWENESDDLAPAVRKPPRRKFMKWKRFFGEPNDRRKYWETLTEKDTGSSGCEPPQDSPAKVSSDKDAIIPATEDVLSATSGTEDTQHSDGACKKVLLVSASTQPTIAPVAPPSRFGVTGVQEIDSDDSGCSPGEVTAASQSSLQIHFRLPKPKEAAARQDGGLASGEERDMTTLWKTTAFSRFTMSLSTAVRDVIVMATTRRFFMLIIYCVATLMPAFQWIQYSIISNIVQQYYHVSSGMVSWTSMIFYVVYVTMALPCAWVLDNYGIRVTVLCGACSSAIGSCIKLFSIDPDRFGYVIIGQALPALATAFTAAVPSRLASAWFKYEEISTATSAGMLGVHVGIALGFFVPPQAINREDIGGSLRALCIGVAAVSCAAFLLTIAFFSEKPKHPPSFSEMLNRYAKTKASFREGMQTLMSDRDFILLLLSYGINTGGFYSISTLLNPVIITYFPSEESFAGILGLSMVFSGLLGSWVGGVIVDKTNMFKEVTLAAYIFSTIALFLHTLLLLARSHALTTIACLFLGFFMTGYMPLGVQLGAEITYPLNEGMPSSLLIIAAQGASLVITPICTFVQAEFGYVASNLVVTGMFVIGCLLTVMLRAELKRHKAYKRELVKRLPTATPTTRRRSSSTEESDTETAQIADTESAESSS
ncbi:hypothetical protein V5799_008750 [Amblyomma americanum]|uniref:Uncharacterized protein n=1 Tax=Amblyomma americanum TaxID=6943 RepID=A0AAQ4FC50_AMBAM